MAAAARPYRAYLTAALHRRFVNAAACTGTACFIVSLLLNDFHIFWSWFPLGPAGIYAAAVFLCTLLVDLIRVSSLRMGKRHSEYRFAIVLAALRDMSTLYTFAAYCLSAFIFGELWIWTASTSANLTIIDPGKPYERAKLNERPIFFRSMMLLLGIAQSLYHIYRDENRIPVPTPKVALVSTDAHLPMKGTSTAHALTAQRLHLAILKKSFVMSIVMALLGTIVYLATPLRRWAWHFTHQWAELIWTSIPRNSKMTSNPTFVGDLLWRFVVAAFVLSYLWDFTNAAFTAGLAKPPLKMVDKRQQVLSEGSAKANATLISGLKARRDVVRTNAFWELVLIAAQRKDRRINIYKDVHGSESCWADIMTVSLAELHAVVRRIQLYTGESKPEPVSDISFPATSRHLNGNGLQGNSHIFASKAPPTSLRDLANHQVSGFVRSAGNHPGEDTITPTLKRMVKYGADQVMTENQLKVLSPKGVSGLLHLYLVRLLKTPFGVPFRQTFSRRTACVILGGPDANVSILVDATMAIAMFARAAVKEDSYALVFENVGSIIRTYTSTVEKIESFLRETPPHWTDVRFRENDRLSPDADVQLVVDVLKQSLAGLCHDYRTHYEELGLSPAEARRAQAACAPPSSAA